MQYQGANRIAEENPFDELNMADDDSPVANHKKAGSPSGH